MKVEEQMVAAQKLLEQRIKDWMYEYAKFEKSAKSYGGNSQLIDHLKMGLRTKLITQEHYDEQVIKYGLDVVAEVIFRRLRAIEMKFESLADKFSAWDYTKDE